MNKKVVLSLLFIIFFTTKNVGQSRLGIFLGAGTTWYYGDMNDRLLTHPRLFRNYFNGGLIYNVSPHINVTASFAIGKITGADSLAIQDFNIKRNLHFTSSIWEGSLRLEYKLIASTSGKSKRRIIPYVFGGIGYFHHNPKATIGGQSISLQPLGTEGQFINGNGYPKPYSLYQLSVPLGLGVEFPLSRAFALRVEISNHFSFTDYLDDVSGKYADSTKLSTTPNGPLSVELASNLNRNYPTEGFGRGNPKNNDTFMFFGAALVYRPVYEGTPGYNKSRNGNGKGKVGGGRKKRKGSCPAFD